MRKILFVSDSCLLYSGMGIVGKNLATRICRDFDLKYFGWHYQGQPHNLPFQLIPGIKGTDQNAYESLKKVIQITNSEMIILFGDYFYFPYVPALKFEFPYIKVVGYINVDSEPLNYDCVPYMKEFDKIICTTKWGAKLLGDLDPTINPTYVYHGIDTEVFKPLDDCEFQGISKNSGQFIVIYNQQNTMRHNPATALEGFNIFAKDKNDVLMIMNTNPNDPAGFKLFNIVKKMNPNSASKVLISQNQNIEHGIPDEELNKLYNIGSCYLSTSTAEGFGLCLGLESYIQTKSGVKQLRNIVIGDFVLSGDGRFHKVLNKVSRKAKVNGLKVVGSPEIEITPEHPLLRLPVPKFNKRKKMVQASKYINEEPEWVKVSDLRVGDMVAYPRPKLNIELPEKIDLLDWIDDKKNVKYDDEFVWSKYGFSPNTVTSLRDICILYGITKGVAEDASMLATGRKLRPQRGGINSLAYKIAQELIKAKYVNSQPNKIKRFISINKDFLWFVGRYIADGSTDGVSKIELDIGAHKEKQAKRLYEISKEVFGFVPLYYKRNESNCIRVILSSKYLSEFS